MKKGLWTIPFIIILLVVTFFPHSTRSTEVGVRVVKWSPFAPSGIVKEIYFPGATYFFPLFINEWHTFDTRLQYLEMTISRRGIQIEQYDLLFKSIDGNDISLDVVITWRIDP